MYYIKCVVIKKMEGLSSLFSLLMFMSCTRGQNILDTYGLLPPKKTTTNISFSNSSEDEVMHSILEDSNTDLAKRAQRALSNDSDINAFKYEVDEFCLNHTKIFLKALVSMQPWALRMIDAMGKPKNDLLDGHLTWTGSYDECITIEAEVNDSGNVISPYTGHYCTASFQLAQPSQVQSLLMRGGLNLRIGVCVPSSCTDQDTKSLINTLLSLLPMNATTLPDPYVHCQTEHLNYDAKAIVALVICSLFGLVMTLATVYDVIVMQWYSKRSKVLPTNKEIEGISFRCVAANSKLAEAATDESSINGNGSTSKKKEAHGHLKITYPRKKQEITPTEKLPQVETGQNLTEENYKSGMLGKVLISFSIYTNGAKILDTHQPRGTLSAVNGIRFFSMTWVILGHNFAFLLPSAENISTYGLVLVKRITFEAIKNALVSVDTFFTISGLLVSYLSLKEMKKRGGAKRFRWGMFYFHRFWRLTPPYMLFMMFYVCLMTYWYNGPNWPQQSFNEDVCGKYWWRNILYINNLFPASKMCMAWSWYLANDMQFYLLSPLMLIPLYYFPILGVLICGVFLLINFISAGIISKNGQLGANVVFDTTGNLFDDYYDKPWCRVGPYVVGVLAGYILYRTNCKLQIPKVFVLESLPFNATAAVIKDKAASYIANLLGWLIAAAMALLTLYGTYNSTGIPTLSGAVAATYNATSRTAWGVAVAWVILACATGNGGWINTLLSWKAFIPLARLTYCAYLVHPVVIFVYLMGRRTQIYYTDLEAVFMYLGNLFVSYIVAFIVSLTFESPMMGLEKALFRRTKRN